MKFNKYHKIRQFRDVIRDINHKAHFVRLDENNNPIYDTSLKKPVLKFKGTIKLHGTNAMITYTPESGIMAGKRSSLLPSDQASAHFQFNGFVMSNKEYFTELMSQLWEQHCEDGEQITLFGEWAGKGIQKNVGISEIEKSFFVFDCKVRNIETDEDKWIDVSQLSFELENVYNINQFKTFEVDIDFNNPAKIQNKLIELTNEVESECPVAKQLRVKENLVGEGIVWTAYWRDEKYIFKVKGEKHSSTKVKKLAQVDTEKLESIEKFVEYACTENRIEQGIQESGAKERSDVGNLIRWIANDIIVEETDTLTDNGLVWKDVAKQVATKTRTYFFEKLF